MAMGHRGERQRPIWLDVDGVGKGPGHPFCEALNRLLRQQGFNAFVEAQCRPFYAPRRGRPSLPPAVYFRLLLIGYFARSNQVPSIGLASGQSGDVVDPRPILGFGDHVLRLALNMIVVGTYGRKPVLSTRPGSVSESCARAGNT